VAILVAAAAHGEGDLAGKGKSDNWQKATAKCRELLGQIKTDDPLTAKYLPNVKRGVKLLESIDKFDWKRRTAVEYVENMLSDLIAGKTPNKRYAGKGMGFPYYSRAMARAEAIWIHVPPSYDPEKSYQIFMYYKCGGGIHYKKGKAGGGYRPTTEVANQTDTFHAWSSLSTQVKGRMGAQHELAEAMDAICREFSVDRDRVFLTGWSDGGFTALFLASRYPHLVAGIVPYCANWQYMNGADVGLWNVPMLVADGWTDGGYNRGQFVRWHILQGMGFDAAALWSHHGHSYTGYEDVEEFKKYMAWAKPKRRNLWPKRVRYSTWGNSWHKAYWVSIERMADPIHPAQIDVQVKDNRVEVKTSHVGAYKLTLSEKLIDKTKPVTVVTDGKESYSGAFKAEIAVDVTPAPAGKFVKGAAMPGDIVTQIERSTYGSKDFLKIADRRWVFVKGTGGGAETQKLLRKWFGNYAKADTAVTDRDIANRNLIVFGGPDINKLAARIAKDLPVTFAKGKFTIGSEVYDEPTHCVTLLHPNPLNPKKYILLHAFNDAATFAKNKYFGMGKESAWRFRSGDCLVKGVKAPQRKWGVYTRDAGFRTDVYVFGPDWRPMPAKTVGELAGSIDETQMMRLRCDAMREAVGADAGAIWGYTPGYQRWRMDLPAGPVTAHDIATFDRLPQYIVTGQVTGVQLKGIAAGCPATTLPAKIDEKKTYRLAMGYSNLPSYGVEYRKMPKHYVFSTPEEFLACKLTKLSVRNMKMLPLTMSEAVIRYIEKRKVVAPRPAVHDLTQYVMNPEGNEFGANDWVHLGGDVALGNSTTRYTLALGLREAKAPADAPAPQHSKHFVAVDMTAHSVDFSYAALARKLPVKVAVKPRRFAITADEACMKFGIIKEASGEGVIGRGVLVRITLANSGKTDVVGTAALAPMAMRRQNPGVWPQRRGRNAVKVPYAGHYTATGRYRKPATRHGAALFLLDSPTAPVDRLSVSAGYNFGLVAVKREVSVKAGSAAQADLLFVRINRPAKVKDIDPVVVLNAVTAALRKEP